MSVTTNFVISQKKY